eukprot:CAMPEP_0119017404 /NCGR_PEP_ID=MMETSP1176-20130426/16454_1 /TAXON_ID=265551 /ORGANISM="Synedropsis recta cf, Strain CCMP1620" /LENGTH=378 /DNA_ID=CAMNT_0006971119 /DNA_START=12 /DNA_END=1149 /DNA_ORIENTATION=+
MTRIINEFVLNSSPLNEIRSLIATMSMSNDSPQGCCAFRGGSKCTAVWCISLSAVGFLFALGSASFWAWFNAIVTLVLFSVVGCVSAAPGRIMAAVASPCAFLTFLLQISVSSIIITQGSIYCAQVYSYGGGSYSGSYYNDDDFLSGYYGSNSNNNNIPYYDDDSFDACHAANIALGAIGITGSFLWLAASIVGAFLAYNMSRDMDTDKRVQRANTVGASATYVGATKQEVTTEVTTQYHEPDIDIEVAHAVSVSAVEESYMSDGTNVVATEQEPDIEVANTVPVGGSSSVRDVERNMVDDINFAEENTMDPNEQQIGTNMTHDRQSSERHSHHHKKSHKHHKKHHHRPVHVADLDASVHQVTSKRYQNSGEDSMMLH